MALPMFKEFQRPDQTVNFNLAFTMSPLDSTQSRGIFNEQKIRLQFENDAIKEVIFDRSNILPKARSLPLIEARESGEGFIASDIMGSTRMIIEMQPSGDIIASINHPSNRYRLTPSL